MKIIDGFKFGVGFLMAYALYHLLGFAVQLLVMLLATATMTYA